jgi:heat shock protein HslJ
VRRPALALFLPALLLTLAVAACGDDDGGGETATDSSTESSTDPSTDGTVLDPTESRGIAGSPYEGQWRLAQIIRLNEATEIASAAEATIEFAPDGFTGFTGCNDFTGDASVVAGEPFIAFLLKSVTRADCPSPETEELETIVLRVLTGPTRAEIDEQGRFLLGVPEDFQFIYEPVGD